MSIAVVCPKCAARLNAPDAAAGKRVKCPKCQTGIAVPAAVAEASPFEVVEEPAPVMKAKPATKQTEQKPTERPKAKAVVVADDDEEDEKPRKRRVQAVVEDDEDEERPRKKKRKATDEEAGNSRLTRNIIGSVVLLILLGVAGWVYYDKFGKPPREIVIERKDDDTQLPFIPPPGGPRPNPVGAGQTAKVASAERLITEWRSLVTKTLDTLGSMKDATTVRSGIEQLQAYVSRAKELGTELKALGPLSVDELRSFRLKQNAQEMQVADNAVRAAAKDLGRRLVSVAPDQIEAVMNVIADWDKGDLACREATRFVLGQAVAGTPDPVNPSNPSKADTFTLVTAGRFKVTFPGRYATNTIVNEASLMRFGAAAKLYACNLPKVGTFGALACDLPAKASADETKAIYQKLTAYLVPEGTEIARGSITVKGRQWEEVTFQDPVEKNARVVRLLRTDKSIYALVGELSAGEPLTRFLDSFELLE